MIEPTGLLLGAGDLLWRVCGAFARKAGSAALAALMIAAPSAAWAQACQGSPGVTVNAGFELPDIRGTTPAPVTTFGSNPFARLYNQTNVPGWSTTASTGNIEIWETGFNGVPSYAGRQFAEVNSDATGALFQDIQTTPGSTIIWSFAHRGRAGTDTVRVQMGAPGGTLSNQGTFSTGNTAWSVKTGSYVVPAGQTTTRFQFLAVSTASGSNTVGNFIDAVIISPLCDYGDAPSSYPVLRSNGGAAHRISNVGFLGSSVDADFDGLPSALANGDDLNATDDEDGVVFGIGGNAQLIRRARNFVRITASAAGYVNMWLDYDQNGTWSASERVLSDRSVSAGTQSIGFTVPATASTGPTFARVRYSIDNPAGAMGPGGDWDNGEVEDLRIVVISQAVLEVAKSSQSFVQSGVGDGSDFRIPGNDVLYTLEVSNIGEGPVDQNSVFIVDALPADIIFFNGDANGTGAGNARVLFNDNGSGLTFNANTDVAFADGMTAPANFADCNLAGAAGYDQTIRFVCLNPQGTMTSGTSQPSFQLQFRARIR